MVDAGLLVSRVTVLSVEVLLPLPAASVAPLAGIEAMTVPSVVIPETATSYVVPSLGATCDTATDLAPPAVPEICTSEPVNPVTDSLNTAVKWIGELFVGSFWPDAWLIVTDGASVSLVKLTD